MLNYTSLIWSKEQLKESKKSKKGKLTFIIFFFFKFRISEIYFYRELDAFLYDAVILDYRAGQDDGCKLRVVGSWYSMTGYGIALPKGSKYKEMFDRKIIEYSHSGELERTQNFWFSGTCKNQEESTRNSHQFGLLQSSSVFILLLAGIAFSVISLVASHLFENYIKNGKTKSWFYENKTKPNGVFNILNSNEQGEIKHTKNMVIIQYSNEFYLFYIFLIKKNKPICLN